MILNIPIQHQPSIRWTGSDDVTLVFSFIVFDELDKHAYNPRQANRVGRSVRQLSFFVETGVVKDGYLLNCRSDFLVVTKNNSEKTSEQESTVTDRVDRYKPPVNLEIYGIGLYQRRIDKKFMDLVI